MFGIISKIRKATLWNLKSIGDDLKALLKEADSIVEHKFDIFNLKVILVNKLTFTLILKPEGLGRKNFGGILTTEMQKSSGESSLRGS